MPQEVDRHAQFVDEPVFGSRVFLWEAGVGNPYSIVLVHGLGQDGSQVWDGLAPLLAKRYHVVSFDLPGLGRSSKPDALYSPRAYADFVRWVVDRCVTGQFALVGHSLGGAIALRYAAEYPDHLDRLLLIDVAGVLHRRVLANKAMTPDLSGRTEWLPEPAAQTLQGWIRSAVESIPTSSLDLGPVLMTPFLRQRILRGDPARIAALALAEEDFSGVPERVRAPTTILWGRRDPVAQLRTGKLLAHLQPRARLRIIEGAGHEPMREQPAVFEAEVLDWLAADTGSQPAVRRELEPGDRSGACAGQKGVTFAGAYDRLEIVGCTDVSLEGVSARRIDITDSTVEIEDCSIRGGEAGLIVRGSTVRATGLRVEAADAVVASDSRLDLAGAELVGERNAVRAEKPSTLLFSISRAQSPHTRGALHGPREVTAQTPL